jgi:threonine/homoserine/homoserine lactone efflux protein
MALVTRSALVLGPRTAFACALGISLGTLVWGAASAVGLAAVLTTSETAFTVARFVGAAYLVWLGISTRTPVRGSVWLGRPMRVAFRQGLVSNLLNPRSASSTR